MNITESQIRARTTIESFEKGENYYESGYVLEAYKRGDSIYARVEGSSEEPYQVIIRLGKNTLLSTECNCPYDWGGDCKHIVAVLLTCINKPDQVIEKPTIDQLIANLEEKVLRELFGELLNAKPRLIEWVEDKLSLKYSSQKTSKEKNGTRVPNPPIDLTPFKKEVNRIMRNNYERGNYERDYYELASGIAEEMYRLLKKIKGFVRRGDGQNALRILEEVIPPYVDSWYEYDDSDGELGDVFDEIGHVLTVAFLEADLPKDEREDWLSLVREWEGECSGYGIDDSFDTAIAALEEGWEDPRLQKILRGEVVEEEVREEEPWYSKQLTSSRLRVLKWQEKFDEYLCLAKAERMLKQYLTMLVQVGRETEAIEYAITNMTKGDEALSLSKALREKNLSAEALKIAEYGLGLEDKNGELARWTRDFAIEMNQRELALKAGRKAFTNRCSIEEYLAIQGVAGEEWSVIKGELIQEVASSKNSNSKIEIYLIEGMVDEAIQVVNRERYIDEDLLKRVAIAGITKDPLWVIKKCKQIAEPIMDEGKSKYYDTAIKWLEIVKKANLESHQEENWKNYIEELIKQHARKTSLKPQLMRLR